VANRSADLSIRRDAPWLARRNFLIDTPPIRIAPNSFTPNTNQVPNRRKAGDLGSLVFTSHHSLITTHSRSNRNCPELEIAVTPLPSSKLDFLIATAKGGTLTEVICPVRLKSRLFT
jgi:hypothetical protein